MVKDCLKYDLHGSVIIHNQFKVYFYRYSLKVLSDEALKVIWQLTTFDFLIHLVQVKKLDLKLKQKLYNT